MAEEIRVVTADDLATIRKLESIFLPHSHAQREWKRDADNPNVPYSPDNMGWFAHYTSADAALKIIKAKRLWMRSTTCMGDYREVRHGYDLLVKYFQTEGKRQAFLAAMDAVRPGDAQDILKLFDEQWWKTIQLNTYITSLSDHNVARESQFGRLSMWRAFGAGQPRVSLVFKVPWQSQATLALGAMFGPVAYLSEADAHQSLDNCVANVTREADWIRSIPPEQFKGFLFQLLASTVCCMKHEGFWEEREWRGVYIHGLNAPSLLESSTQVINGVPQKVFEIPFDERVSPALADLDLSRSLDRVIIGPSSYGWVMYEAFVDALREAGVPEPESRVWTSNLPIRD